MLSALGDMAPAKGHAGIAVVTKKGARLRTQACTAAGLKVNPLLRVCGGTTVGRDEAILIKITNSIETHKNALPDAQHDAVEDPGEDRGTDEETRHPTHEDCVTAHTEAEEHTAREEAVTTTANVPHSAGSFRRPSPRAAADV